MSVKERDPLTGHGTTGHEWNGITELNTRVPTAIWLFAAAAHLYALLVWILLPSWPLVTTYTKGLIGNDPHEQVEKQVTLANAARAGWADRITAMPVKDILADTALMTRVRGTAHALFGDNCAACHGVDATGGPGFPDLVDGAWLWGGTPDAIMETLRVGINSQHPETRFSQMPAFGRDGMLTRDDIRTVIPYVQSLSGKDVPAEAKAAGAQIFADNCSSCHGDDGHGLTDVGAPNLTDAFWIYGGDAKALFTTIYGGRAGWMPTWEDRLTLVDRKILAAYLLDKGERTGE